MAEFCNRCAKDMGIKKDIDIYKIHHTLKEGYMQSVLCEGCEIIAVSKEDDGSLMVGYPDRKTGEVKWMDYPLKSDLEKDVKTIILEKLKNVFYKNG